VKHSLPLLALTLFALLLAPLTVAAQTAAPTPPAATAAPAATGKAEKVITVKVALESGKAGQALAADTRLQDAAVTLYVLKGQSPVDRREGKTDAAGTAQFTAVPYEDGYGYGVVAKLRLTPYISQLVTPKAGATEVLVPVKVYGTTTDTSKLRVSQAFVLAEAQGEGKLGITNLYILSNDGDKTIEGGLKDAEGKPATVQFPLPSGAQDVKFSEDDGSGIAQIDGAFVSRPGVQPGEGTGRVLVSYSMPYSDSLKLESGLAYPTDKLSVFVATQGITLTGSLMKNLGPQRREDGVTMNAWGAEKIAADQIVSYQLKGKPEVPPPLPASAVQAGPRAAPAGASGLKGFVNARKPVELAGMGLIAVGLLLGVFAAGWLLYRTRLAGRSAQDPESQQLHALLAALADLQEDREAGRVEPKDYEQRRLLLSEALASLSAPAPLVPTPLAEPEAS
jgi:hypothetical protein